MPGCLHSPRRGEGAGGTRDGGDRLPLKVLSMGQGSGKHVPTLQTAPKLPACTSPGWTPIAPRGAGWDLVQGEKPPNVHPPGEAADGLSSPGELPLGATSAGDDSAPALGGANSSCLMPWVEAPEQSQHQSARETFGGEGNGCGSLHALAWFVYSLCFDFTRIRERLIFRDLPLPGCLLLFNAELNEYGTSYKQGGGKMHGAGKETLSCKMKLKQ